MLGTAKEFSKPNLYSNLIKFSHMLSLASYIFTKLRRALVARRFPSLGNTISKVSLLFVELVSNSCLCLYRVRIIKYPPIPAFFFFFFIPNCVNIGLHFELFPRLPFWNPQMEISSPLFECSLIHLRMAP